MSAKGFSMNRKYWIILLLFSVGIYAEKDSVESVEMSRLEKIEKKVTKIISKAGINFGGEFRSQYLHSQVVGADVDPTKKIVESVEYTSVDFDISARPNAAITGKLLLRLHTDWRNFFTALKSPIFARWMSIDGNFKNIFTYNIGDFRQHYSPLTLYSPDIDIDFEPELFARMRRMAMGEKFLADNDRILMGLNMNFDAEVSPLFKEFHLNVMGTRLRTAYVGQEAFIHSFEASDMDKYAIATNLNTVIIPDLTLGATYLNIWDWVQTFGGTIPEAEQYSQVTQVPAVRVGFGTAPFIKPEKINIKVNLENAWSFDREVTKVNINSKDSTVKSVDTENIKGNAFNVDLLVKAKLGSLGKLKVNIGFLNNNKNFRNDLAQTPSLFKSRIMNTENDYDLLNGKLYSSFDDMYRHVYKFCPTIDNENENSFFKGPMTKIAYTNVILTQDEMKGAPVDSALFRVMPYGAATANRKGPKGELSLSLLDKAVLVSVKAKSLKESEGTLKIDSSKFAETEFYEVNGGVSVDFAGFGDWWPYPIVISYGLTKANASNDEKNLDNTVDFHNLGLYWKFWKRAAFLAGYQKIVNKGLLGVSAATMIQEHFGVGLEYKISDGGALTGSFGFVDVSYFDFPEVMTNEGFRQYQIDFYLTVNF